MDFRVELSRFVMLVNYFLYKIFIHADYIDYLGILVLASCIRCKVSVLPNIEIISNKAGPSSEPKTANRNGIITFPKPYDFFDAKDLISDSKTSELQVSSEVNMSLH